MRSMNIVLIGVMVLLVGVVLQHSLVDAEPIDSLVKKQGSRLMGKFFSYVGSNIKQGVESIRENIQHAFNTINN